MAQRPSGHRRHVPERRCVACRQARAKRELVRVVRTVEGSVVIDPTGKRSGRGAYLCRARSCWEQALRRRALEYALKTTIGPEDRKALVAYSVALPEARDSAGQPAPASGS